MKLPDWILMMIGRRVANRLGLQEDSNMNAKPWYQSKSIWTAVLGGLVGVYGAIGTIHPLPPIPEWLLTLLASAGLYSLRVADKKIG